jgi:6-pyruvoyl-tetrahydropterin synthase
MYRIIKGVHVHFAHHVRGHRGACISVHGHTWKLEVTLAARDLDSEGFVRDFADVRRQVLDPAYRLLDHSLAIGADTWAETRHALMQLGDGLVASREVTMGHRGERQEGIEGVLAGARNEFPGDIKVSVFPFAPTSERLAEWLYDLAFERLADERVQVVRTRVYETLHPTESIAEYEPG